MRCVITWRPVHRRHRSNISEMLGDSSVARFWSCKLSRSFGFVKWRFTIMSLRKNLWLSKFREPSGICRIELFLRHASHMNALEEACSQLLEPTTRERSKRQVWSWKLEWYRTTWGLIESRVATSWDTVGLPSTTGGSETWFLVQLLYPIQIQSPFDRASCGKISSV